MDIKEEIQKIADAIKVKLNIEYETVNPFNFDELIESIDSGLNVNKEKNILNEYNILPGSKATEGDFVQKVKGCLYRQDIINISAEDICQYEILAIDDTKILLLYCTKEGLLILSILDKRLNINTLLLQTNVSKISNVIYKDNFLGFNTNEGFSIIHLDVNEGVIHDYYIDRENHELIDFSKEVLIYKEPFNNITYVTNLCYSEKTEEISMGEYCLLFDLQNAEGLNIINLDEELDLYLLFYLDTNTEEIKYMLFHIDGYIYEINVLKKQSEVAKIQISKILFDGEYVRFYYVIDSQLYCTSYKMSEDYENNNYQLIEKSTFLYNIQADISNILDISYLEEKNAISIIYKNYKKDYYNVILIDKETEEFLNKTYLFEFNDNDDFKVNKNKVSHFEENKLYLYNFFLDTEEYQVSKIRHSMDEIVGIIDLITKKHKAYVYEPKRED